MIRFPVLFFVLFSAFQEWLTSGDINFPAFSRDPEGKASHLRLIGGATVDYFSTEFNELCPEIGGPIDPPNGITQRFQHPQMREDPNYASLPTYRYMKDDQLDNPYAGRVSHGEHTEIVETKAYIPDDDLLVLPHNRTQLCHYAIRLTPPERMVNSATWYRFKQVVAYGFETEFHFRILHRSRTCTVAGQESDWCEESGGDGFAFVIQNDGRKAVGSQSSGMGYGFKNNLAIEFDTQRHVEFGERSKNHISVMVAPRIEQANTANHGQAEIAYTDDIPALGDGTHAVRIKYDPRGIAWDQLGAAFESDMDGDFMRLQASGRQGLLTVEIDGRRVISVKVDLNNVAKIDRFELWRANPPLPPNITAYDEAGGYPGKAWVGFTSSTNYYQSQSVDILSWTFTEKPECLDDGATEIMCRINEGTRYRRLCREHGGENEFCTFNVRNIARQAVTISARYKYDKEFEFWPCSAGKIEWNALHPYFLGCRMPVSFTADLEELWLSTVDGTRTLMITEPFLLGQEPVPFRRESHFEYCTLEHKHDPWRLYFAECNCEYCLRLLDVQTNYAVYYQHRCTTRYSLRCPCFEASEVDIDQSDWTLLEPLKFMRIHTCRGCAYPSQCAMMLKVATCEIAYQEYRVGNPLAPTPESNGFESLLRDEGRVLDGRLRGDACVCEPSLRPYRGDPNGRSGECDDAGLLNEVYVPVLDECQQLCAGAAKCNFLVFWDDGQCKIFQFCDWKLCRDARCFSAYVFRMAPLGPYIDTRGEVQKFQVFPLRTIQTRPRDCFECLRQYDEEYCIPQCGPGKSVGYMHWPSGQSCATCIFAGNRMHELTLQETEAVKGCVYAAIRVGTDPWIECDELVQKEADVPALDLFNGVATHFLSECPGRAFREAGAVCVPNLHARPYFGSQVLSRMAARNNEVWGPALECLNALCHVVPRETCYERMARWEFTTNFDDSMDYQIRGTAFNSASAIGGTLRLDKDRNQYVVTDPLPFNLENTTLEVWTLVDESETVTDVALLKPIEANTNWRTDYESLKAVDGEMDTYWSSQLGEVGQMAFDAVWYLDLGSVLSVGQVVIHWYQPAADFKLFVTADNVTWLERFSMTGNGADLTELNSFFKARWLRLEMTRAAALRPEGPGVDHPVYSIREFEVFTDDNLARLKPTVATYSWSRPARLAHDGDNETYWATPPNTPSAYIMFDFGSIMNDVTIVEVKWRYRPQKVAILWGDRPCDEEMPSNELELFSGAQVSRVLQDRTAWNGQCFLVQIYRTLEVFGEQLAGLEEVELYQEGENLAENATVWSTFPADDGIAHDTPVEDAMDGNPATAWLVKTVNGNANMILSLGKPKLVIAIRIRWAFVGGTEYIATRFETSAGETLGTMRVVDAVTGSFARDHRFVLWEYAQFIKLEVTQIPGTAPGGKVGLEDIIIHAASDNIAERSTTVAIASTEWTNCTHCYKVDDASTYIHGADMATDGDQYTWWGAPLGVDAGIGTNLYWEVFLAAPSAIDVVAIDWRFPASTVSVWCAFDTGGRLTMAGDVELNLEYQTIVAFAVTRTCQQVRVYMSQPLASFAEHTVLGIREVGLHSTVASVAMNKPTFPSDGTDGQWGVDANQQSKWQSFDDSPVNYTVDLGSPVAAWGCRSLWSSGMLPRSYAVAVSNNTFQWTVLRVYEGNTNRDVYTVRNFVARYVMLQLYATSGLYYGLRTLEVYNTPNLALNRPAAAEQTWFHGGWESVDGINTTFWVSEPFSTSCTLQVDLLKAAFIGAGVHINWKFPAEDFEVWYSLNQSADSNWTMLYKEKNNTAYRTSIDDDFEAQFVEIRMTRPSALNGDASFAIYDFDVMFDPNLAHGKKITASDTIDQTQFLGANAIDGARKTIWFPQQNSRSSYLVIDLLEDWVVSGFELEWRHPPVTFSVDRQDPVTLRWEFVRRWTTQRYEKNVRDKQNTEDGFVARRVRVNVEEAEMREEGLICSLREVLLYTFVNVNQILKQPVEASAQISGNPAPAAVDGNVKGTYWMPGEFITSAWLLVYAAPSTNPIQVARGSIWWRFNPGTFYVEFFEDERWSLVYSETNSTEKFTDYFFLRKMWKLRVTITQSYMNGYIGIFGLAIYPSIAVQPPAVEVGDPDLLWQGTADRINDLNEGTYWMAPPNENDVTILMDLGKVYDVFDIFVWFGFRSQGFELYTSVDNVNEVRRPVTSTSIFGRLRLEYRGTAFPCRFIRVFILKSYADEEEQLGTSIRDIAVYKFRNLARGRPSDATSVWEYPAEKIVDGDENTFWLSQFDTEHAEIVVDLGEPKNVAGVKILFGYLARRMELRYTDNVSQPRDTWKLAYSNGNNVNPLVEVASKSYHFKGRYVMLKLAQPFTQIFDPDDYGEFTKRKFVFSLHDFKLYEHTGGGGLVGLESLDGKQFSTITYGLRQPGQWIIASESDQYTKDLDGGVYPEDIEDPSALVVKHTQLVITFKTVWKTKYQRALEISLFRNGIPYGEPYTVVVPVDRLIGLNKTRLVIGTRGSIFANASADPSQVAGIHGLSHSPYYAGRVYNVTVIRNALTQEEIQGLYSTTQGGQELGCHCFDACKLGHNRFFPTVPVPCSGQGACLRNPTGLPLGPGVCHCLPGYSGEACEHHCSDLSKFGCCEVDDDCPTNIPCNNQSKACFDNFTST